LRSGIPRCFFSTNRFRNPSTSNALQTCPFTSYFGFWTAFCRHVFSFPRPGSCDEVRGCVPISTVSRQCVLQFRYDFLFDLARPYLWLNTCPMRHASGLRPLGRFSRLHGRRCDGGYPVDKIVWFSFIERPATFYARDHRHGNTLRRGFGLVPFFCGRETLHNFFPFFDCLPHPTKLFLSSPRPARQKPPPPSDTPQQVGHAWVSLPVSNLRFFFRANWWTTAATFIRAFGLLNRDFPLDTNSEPGRDVILRIRNFFQFLPFTASIFFSFFPRLHCTALAMSPLRSR